MSLEVLVLALVVVLLVITALLSLVTTGLLRSHADILRALHDIGAGVGDPGTRPSRAPDAEAGGRPGGAPVHLRAGPPLPPERSSTSVHDLEGVSPGGDAVVASMATSTLTLLAFLSSGCVSCAGFWSALGDPARLALLPSGIRVVIVTKGPEWESPEAISALAPRGIAVLMSTAAWDDYEVPGSPFFALVDGAAGIRVGEGVGAAWEQVADLVHRAERDASGRGHAPTGRPDRHGAGGAGRVGAGGAVRERANDVELRDAGILPGHPSLYPRRLEDVFAATEHLADPTGPSPG